MTPTILNGSVHNLLLWSWNVQYECCIDQSSNGNKEASIPTPNTSIFTSTQILKMSYNKLTEVDAGLFQGLVGLVRLHLDHNLISFIQPYSFSGLPSLKLLQLEGNVLRDLHPHTFITLSLLGTFWSSGLR